MGRIISNISDHIFEVGEVVNILYMIPCEEGYSVKCQSRLSKTTSWLTEEEINMEQG